MARLACWLSAGAVLPFWAIANPPTRTKGRRYSARIFNCATARAVAASYISRWVSCAPTSSARAVITSTFSSCRVSTICLQKSAFLPMDSTRVRRKPGMRIFSGMPGKPAPVPISIKEVGGSISRQAYVQVSESRKCFLIMSAGSRIAVRLICSFQESSSRA